MNTRTTLLLALVLVVLAGAATIVQTTTRKARSPEGKPLFAAFSLEKTDAFAITRSGKEVRFERKGEQWMVATEGGHLADQKRAKEVLDKIALMKTVDVVSTSRDKHTSFGVDTTATRITAYTSGKETANLLVGEPGPDFMSCYVRADGKNDVYRVPGNLSSMVQRDDTWRNQTLLEVPREEIVGWTTRNSTGTITVTQAEGGVWKITEPVEASAQPQIAKIVLDSLVRIRASGFADSVLDLASVGLDPDTMSVEIRMKDGKSHKLVVGTANAASQSFTKKSDDPTVYLVPKGRWNTVFRPLETLRVAEGTPDLPTIVGPGEKASGQ